MSQSFYLFFCTYLFYFVLISSLRPIFCPSSTSSSSFHGNFSFFLSRSQSDHLLPQASSSSFSSHGQITYPPQVPISTTRTTRIKSHKHGLRWPTSTDLRRQHWSTSIQTHFHRLMNSDLAPLASIHQSTSDQYQHWSVSLLVCPCGCVYVSLC